MSKLTGKWFLVLGKGCALFSGMTFTAWLFFPALLLLYLSPFLLTMSAITVDYSVKSQREFYEAQRLSKLGALPLYAAVACLALLGLAFLSEELIPEFMANERAGFAAIFLLGALVFWIIAIDHWSYGEDKSSPRWRYYKGEPRSKSLGE